MQKQIPFIRKIIPAKQEPVETFLKRMEKKGKDELTRCEKHFANVKEHNEQYKQKLFLVSYKPPINELPYKPTIHKKHRLKYSEYINLHLKFPKEFDESPEVKTMTVEHSIIKIIGAEPIHKVGHIPKVELAREEVIQNGKLQEGEKVVGLNVTFYYESDYKRFIKLLDYEKCSYISKVYGKTITLEHKKHNIPSRVINTKVHKVFMSIEQANKFIKGTLQIEIDSVEQLGNIAAIKTA